MKKILACQVAVICFCVIATTSVCGQTDDIRDPNGYVYSDYIRISEWPEYWFIYDRMSIDIAFDAVKDQEYVEAEIRLPHIPEYVDIVLTDGSHIVNCFYDRLEDNQLNVKVPVNRIQNFDRYFGLSLLFIGIYY